MRWSGWAAGMALAAGVTGAWGQGFGDREALAEEGLRGLAEAAGRLEGCDGQERLEEVWAQARAIAEWRHPGGLLGATDEQEAYAADLRVDASLTYMSGLLSGCAPPGRRAWEALLGQWENGIEILLARPYEAMPAPLR